MVCQRVGGFGKKTLFGFAGKSAGWRNVVVNGNG